MRSTKWDRTSILKAIRKAHREGLDLSYNATARRNQALISACNYHYKGYKNAVDMAGFDYSQIIRKPWWTPPWVVRLIKQAKRAGEDLSWRVVSKRRDPLGHAAIAAVRPRLFGSWDKALEAAGVDVDQARRYQGWSTRKCLQALRDRSKAGRPVNSGAIQKDLPGLYGAVVRQFGRFDLALVEAGIDPASVRQRRVWTRAEVLKQLAQFQQTHGQLTPTLLRKHDYSLQKAAVAKFGKLEAAVRQLGKVPALSKAAPASRKAVRVEAGKAPQSARRRTGKPDRVVHAEVKSDGQVTWKRPALPTAGRARARELKAAS